MTIAKIISCINDYYAGLNILQSWGETSFFYNPDNILKRGVYFCTIKEKDGENDRASSLDRENVFRFNFFVSQELFQSLFGEKLKRPQKGGVVEGDWDFTQINSLMPHPVYGWMNWVSVLNPSSEMWNTIIPLLNESYDLTVGKYKKRV